MDASKHNESAATQSMYSCRRIQQKHRCTRHRPSHAQAERLHAPPSAQANPHLQLLGGFAGRISPKRHNTPAFPQVGEANSERPSPKTAQKSRTMAKSAPISCETVQNPRGRDRGQGRGSRKRRCGRASDIAGSYPQARPQQPPAPTANGAPTATWTHPCSRSSRIGGQLGLRISMTNTPTTAIMIPQHTSDEEKGFSEK